MSTNRFRKGGQAGDTFDFNSFTEKGLAPFLKLLKKAGSEVSEVNATNRARRQDGQPIKRAMLFFEDGQKAELSITNDGDLFRVKVNGRVTPIDKMERHADLAKGLHSALKSSAAAFAKQQERKLKKAKVAPLAAPRASISNKQRLSNIRAETDKQRQNNAALEEQLTKLQDAHQQRATELQGLDGQLADKQAKVQELKVKIAQLEAADVSIH